jgi:glycerol-3-phosphate acyltransferase PlsY
MTPGPAILAAAVAMTYLEASIPPAYLLGRAQGVDIRDLGTGNPGTANLFRNAGLWPAALAGPLTFLQGLIPVALARLAGWDDGTAALLAVAAAVGNGFPFVLAFHGGRVVAVGTGAITGLCPPALAIVLVGFAAGALLRILAVATLVGFGLAILVAWQIQGSAAAAGAAVVLAVLLVRRLDGLPEDLRSGDPAWRVIVGRLALDRRPEQRLVGPRPRP